MTFSFKYIIFVKHPNKRKMEDDQLEMGMFDNLELNYDGNFPSFEDEQEEHTEENENENINNPIEDNSPEEVDSGQEDDSNEGNDYEDDSSSSSNIFPSLASVLHEQGLLPSLNIEETPIKSVDDFVGAFKKELELQTQTKLDEYIANIDVNNIAQSRQIINDLNNLSEDNLRDDVNLAKEIIFNDYMNQGLDQNKAIRLLNRIVDSGEDAIIEDALESLESLKEFEGRRIEEEKVQYQKQLEANKEAQIKFEDDLKKVVFEKKDLINGYKPTKALQDKVYKTINDIVGKSPEGAFENKFMRERRMNPMEFEARMYFFYELTNGFTDYSKLTTSAKTSAVKDLEKVARQNIARDNGTPLWAKDPNSYGGNFGSELNF